MAQTLETTIRAPDMLQFTNDLALAVSDFYEWSMAHANVLEGIRGIPSVFDLVVRSMPGNKVVGSFLHNGVKYDELAERKFAVNAGLEQAAACFLQSKGNKRLRDYMENVQGIQNRNFLDWVETMQFKGDVYAMAEGTIFFSQEHQLRVHERFEEAQIFESLLLSTINPQTNVATVANDIAAIANKILLEGGSRRGTSPQSALFNSRAARIGGFTASSNVAYGMLFDEKVDGTHGHSYVMLHPSEYAAFKAQAKAFKGNICFLLDTYKVKEAFETALKIIKEEGLQTFAFRIDSGDLLTQAKWLHSELAAKGYQRKDYALVASDDLTAGKIAVLEREGADIDRYLVGTYVVTPAKPMPGVYKLAAFEAYGQLTLRGKLSEDFGKATLPGIKQVFRVTGPDGYHKKDVIAFEGEDIGMYLEEGDTAPGLLAPIILGGKQACNFPSVARISQFRKEQLQRFRDIDSYPVIVSKKILAAQQRILAEHGMSREVYAADSVKNTLTN